MNTKIIIPQNVKELMTYLEGLDFEVFVVGGCVRDSLLGRKPNDWDMCTNGSPKEILSALGNKYTVIPTGLKHGTVSVVIDKNVYEITTYRKEEGYSDSRHPDKVSFVSSLKEDLKRRDFTINAMAYNDNVGLVDIYGGVDDLKSRIIKCVGNPKERFSEDALRILRGIRFSAKLGFSIDTETQERIFELKDKLNSISVERIFDELKGIILCGQVYSVIHKYKSVFETVLGKNLNIDKLYFIDSLPEKLNLRLGAILLQYDDKADILRNLKSDTKTKKAVCCLCENVMKTLPQDKISVKHMMNKFGVETFKDIIIFSKEVNNIDDNMYLRCLSLFDEVLSQNECYKLSQLDISGTDLISRGYRGKEIKEKLEEILNLVIEEKAINDKNVLLRYI